MSEVRRARTLFLFGIPVALLMTCGPNRQLTAQAPAVSALTGPAVLDDWGNRFTSLGASVPENSLRTQVRTTIAQLAMFDAVNAVLDGPYRPFASKPVSVPGASPEAAAIRAAYIVALNEFPTKTATIDSAYNTSIAGVLASPEAIADGIVVGEAAANAVLGRALEITATIRSSRATRPAAAPVCGSRLHPHSRIRRLRSSGSSRRSGMTTPRASVPTLRQRSIAGPTRSTTTRARTSVGLPRRAEPPSSLRLHCSGRHRQARCGAPTSAAWPARWTY